ncbi:MAG TPA: cytochrome c [Candidatus Limnocylindria bacterium]|nr:cytochrome c [Candidatus Limnocylindria bacterium]
MTGRPPLRLLAVLLVLALGGCARETVPTGEALYRRHCASCHGISGRGDGPAAGSLTPRPTDLTTLRMSVQELMQVIDGRAAVQAHGSSAMPVWGEVFEQVHLDGDHAKRIALLTVEALAEYTARLNPNNAPPPARE